MVFLHLDASAVVLHVMPYLSSVGITRSISSLVAMGIPLISIIGRLSSGWLGDTFGKRLIASGCFAVASLGLVLFSYVSNEVMWLLVPFIILFGIGWGGITTIRVSLLVEHFGMSRFGTILGFIMAMSALGNVVGPLFAGWVFDSWGSYYTAWLTFTCLVFVAVIVMATTPPVRR